jgi:hypothetical protein
MLFGPDPTVAREWESSLNLITEMAVDCMPLIGCVRCSHPLLHVTVWSSEMAAAARVQPVLYMCAKLGLGDGIRNSGIVMKIVFKISLDL